MAPAFSYHRRQQDPVQEAPIIEDDDEELLELSPLPEDDEEVVAPAQPPEYAPYQMYRPPKPFPTSTPVFSVAAAPFTTPGVSPFTKPVPNPSISLLDTIIPNQGAITASFIQLSPSLPTVSPTPTAPSSANSFLDTAPVIIPTPIQDTPSSSSASQQTASTSSSIIPGLSPAASTVLLSVLGICSVLLAIGGSIFVARRQRQRPTIKRGYGIIPPRARQSASLPRGGRPLSSSSIRSLPSPSSSHIQSAYSQTLQAATRASQMASEMHASRNARVVSDTMPSLPMKHAFQDRASVMYAIEPKGSKWMDDAGYVRHDSMYTNRESVASAVAPPPMITLPKTPGSAVDMVDIMSIASPSPENMVAFRESAGRFGRLRDFGDLEGFEVIEEEEDVEGARGRSMSP